MSNHFAHLTSSFSSSTAVTAQQYLFQSPHTREHLLLFMVNLYQILPIKGSNTAFVEVLLRTQPLPSVLKQAEIVCAVNYFADGLWFESDSWSMALESNEAHSHHTTELTANTTSIVQAWRVALRTSSPFPLALSAHVLTLSPLGAYQVKIRSVVGVMLCKVAPCGHSPFA